MPSRSTACLTKFVPEGGPDPKLNPHLGYAIANAKRGQLSKESIDKAVAKGQGISTTGAPLDTVLIEAMLPHGVAAIIECLTENKNRILQEVRMVVSRAGGTMAPAVFLFDKKGKIWFDPKDGVGVDEAMDDAIEAGAEEIGMEEDCIVVETAPDMVSAVSTAMKAKLGLEARRTEILYDPKEELIVRLNDEQASKIQSVVDTLEELDDLQELYLNAAT